MSDKLKGSVSVWKRLSATRAALTARKSRRVVPDEIVLGSIRKSGLGNSPNGSSAHIRVVS